MSKRSPGMFIRQSTTFDARESLPNGIASPLADSGGWTFEARSNFFPGRAQEGGNEQSSLDVHMLSLVSLRWHMSLSGCFLTPCFLRRGSRSKAFWFRVSFHPTIPSSWHRVRGIPPCHNKSSFGKAREIQRSVVHVLVTGQMVKRSEYVSFCFNTITFHQKDSTGSLTSFYQAFPNSGRAKYGRRLFGRCAPKKALGREENGIQVEVRTTIKA